MPVAVVFLLRVVVLVLLWGFVAAAVVAVRHDVFGTQPRRVRPDRAPRPPKAAKPPKPPKPQKTQAVPKAAKKAKAAPVRIVIVEGGGEGTSVALSSLPVTIGRAEDSTIVIGDDYASNKHARLVPQGTAWLLEDLGSTNGTLLDGAKVSAAVPAYAGSRVTIGRTVLELR